MVDETKFKARDEPPKKYGFYFLRIVRICSLLEATLLTVHRYRPLFDHNHEISMNEDEEELGLGDMFIVCIISSASLGYD